MHSVLVLTIITSQPCTSLKKRSFNRFKIMKRAMPLDDQMNISSDESLSSEPDIAELAGKLVQDIPIDQPTDIVMTTDLDGFPL